MKEIRIGVVGIGHLGNYHLQKYRGLSNCRIVGVVDIKEERARKAAEMYDCLAMSDNRKLLSSVDAVSIAVPTGLGFSVLSEEIGSVEIGEGSDYFLHLDPLDGTFNAIAGIPFYSVSIYISRDDCRFAYIFDLAHGCSYFAEAGRGAYAGPESRLFVSQNTDLKDFSISAYTLRPNTARIAGIGDRVRRIRTLGSTSLEMALVASGKLDAFVDLRGMMRVVDVAAGKLMIEEAGGLVTDAGGDELQMGASMWQKKYLIGSNGLKHEELLGIIGGDSH